MIKAWVAVAALVVGAAVGYVVGGQTVEPEVDVRTQVEVDEVTPRSCVKAMENGRRFAEGAVSSAGKLHEEQFDLARRAYDLGVQDDEQEIAEGLFRSLAFEQEIHDMWASSIDENDWLGWAGSLENNHAVDCLESQP